MDFYKVLGVDKKATKDQIAKAYRKLAKKYHPDVNPSDTSATDQFKKITEAYEVLSDDAKRSEYDTFGSVGRRGPKPNGQAHPFNDDFFNHFFHSTFHGASKNGKGNHIEVRVNITLEEAAKGCKRTVEFQSKDICKTCTGSGARSTEPCDECKGRGFKSIQQSSWAMRTGCDACKGRGHTIKEKCPDCLGTCCTPPQDDEVQIDIPSGVEHGMQIRLQGLGEPGRHGQSRGDLFVVVLIEDHIFFKRSGVDLILELPMSYTQLVLGTEVVVPTLSEKRNLKIPPGTSNGTKFRIRNQGMPSIRGSRRGDLIVITQVEIPKDLNDDYLEAMKDLALIEKTNITPHVKQYNAKLDESN